MSKANRRTAGSTPGKGPRIVSAGKLEAEGLPRRPEGEGAADGTLGAFEDRLKVNHPCGLASVFFVVGEAIPQPRPRITVRCGFGTAYVPKGHKIHQWRASVEKECRKSIRETITGPVALCMEIMIARPESHFTKRGELSAAGRRITEPGGDWDNLAKAIQDAIVDAAGIEDDRKACGPNVVWKRWACPGKPSAAMVWVSPADLVWCVWGSKDMAAGATA